MTNDNGNSINASRAIKPRLGGAQNRLQTVSRAQVRTAMNNAFPDEDEPATDGDVDDVTEFLADLGVRVV